MLTALRAWKKAFRQGYRRLSLARDPLSLTDFQNVLATLGRPRNRIVMVHGSLSACGYVIGGPRTVIKALRMWGEGTTLAMPAHSYCYPDRHDNAPVFDPEETRSVTGAIGDLFWRGSGVARSLHPTHSLAADGPLAHALIAGHEKCDTPCGAGTPYRRLVEWDAGVLMLGVGLNTYTLFHTAEDAARVPYLYEKNEYLLKVIGRDGTPQEFQLKRQDMTVPRRFAEMDTWLEARDLLQRKRFGRGQLLWIPHAADVHAALVEGLLSDPWMLVDRPHNREVGAASCQCVGTV